MFGENTAPGSGENPSGQNPPDKQKQKKKKKRPGAITYTAELAAEVRADPDITPDNIMPEERWHYVATIPPDHSADTMSSHIETLKKDFLSAKTSQEVSDLINEHIVILSQCALVAPTLLASLNLELNIGKCIGEGTNASAHIVHLSHKTLRSVDTAFVIKAITPKKTKQGGCDYDREEINLQRLISNQADCPNQILPIYAYHIDQASVKKTILPLCNAGELTDHIQTTATVMQSSKEQQGAIAFIYQVVKEVLSALTYLHNNAFTMTKPDGSTSEQGIIHGDVKPANILLNINHKGCLEIKLADFGCSRFIDELRVDPKFLGTQFYASPEKLLLQQSEFNKNQTGTSDTASATDQQLCVSDAWAIGVIIKKMLGRQTGSYLIDENSDPTAMDYQQWAKDYNAVTDSDTVSQKLDTLCAPDCKLAAEIRCEQFLDQLANQLLQCQNDRITAAEALGKCQQMQPVFEKLSQPLQAFQDKYITATTFTLDNQRKPHALPDEDSTTCESDESRPASENSEASIILSPQNFKR